jgi:hypothetical protein
VVQPWALVMPPEQHYRRWVEACEAFDPPPAAVADSLAQIKLDVPRTFPQTACFSLRGGGGGGGGGDGQHSLLEALTRVLSAAVARHPRSGYTQGMNFVAATLLVAPGLTEEQAFDWLCAAIKQFPGFYASSGLEGVIVETQLLGELLASRPVGTHLSAVLGADEPIAVHAVRWLVPLYTTAFVNESVASRVLSWVLALEGSPAQRACNERPTISAPACRPAPRTASDAAGASGLLGRSGCRPLGTATQYAQRGGGGRVGCTGEPLAVGC